FSTALTKSYDRLTAVVPELARLRALYDAVAAAAEAIGNIPRINTSYWLTEYPIAVIPTPREFSLERRRENVQTSRGIRTLLVSGGIQLRPLMLRLQEGDVTALREAVILSRPS